MRDRSRCLWSTVAWVHKTVACAMRTMLLTIDTALKSVGHRVYSELLDGYAQK
jgi:hypothetical protein